MPRSRALRPAGGARSARAACQATARTGGRRCCAQVSAGWAGRRGGRTAPRRRRRRAEMVAAAVAGWLASSLVACVACVACVREAERSSENVVVLAGRLRPSLVHVSVVGVLDSAVVLCCAQLSHSLEPAGIRCAAQSTAQRRSAACSLLVCRPTRLGRQDRVWNSGASACRCWRHGVTAAKRAQQLAARGQGRTGRWKRCTCGAPPLPLVSLVGCTVVTAVHKAALVAVGNTGNNPRVSPGLHAA